MIDVSAKTAIRMVALACLLSLLTAPAIAQTSGSSLRGTVLVADSELDGSVFAQSVILIVQNNDQGSLGVAVNRPAGTTLDKVLPSKRSHARDYALYAGGPVGMHHLSLLLRGSGDRPGFDEVANGVAFTANAMAFDRIIAQAPAPDRVRVIVGYAGWAPGQLETEIENGAWHIVPANSDDIFSDQPEHLWQRLIERIGSDRNPPGHSL